jgi:hypothetical protein
MTQYDNSNTGIISKNDRKELDTHPDIKGQININGEEFWLSGWLKERKDGTGKFYSLKATPKDAKPVTAAGQSYGQASGGGYVNKGGGKFTAGLADLNDEIPFAPEWR